jgi:hypothetical protein
MRYTDVFFSSSDLMAHIEHYEGLKNTGKFTIIENKELLNNIINLHEAVIPRIHSLNAKYYNHQEQLGALIARNIRISPKGINYSELLQRSDILLTLNLGRGLIMNNIVSAYANGIKDCQEVIAQIDTALK